MTLNGIRRRRAADAGFTLPELLITIAILGVIMVALAGAFIAVVRSNQATTDRIGQSHDAQLVANYVVQDAQSADGAGVSSSALCGATGTPALSLTWTSVDSSFGSSTKNVSYTLSGQTVTRWACSGSGGSWSGVTSGTVSHNISSIGYTCSNTTASTTCAAGSTGLKVAVTELQGQANAFNYTLNAAFRKSYGSPSPSVSSFTTLALIVLGNGSGSTCVSYGGNSSITLVGSATAGVNCAGSESGASSINGQFYSTNTCSGCLSNWHSPTPPISDPYIARTYPAPAGGATSSTCPSGKLNPSTYTDITLGNNKNCELQTGTFVITGVLSLGNNSQVTSQAPGVLVSFTGTGNVLSIPNGGSTALQLSALSTTNWPEFAIILPRTSTSALSLSTPTLNLGGVYAPQTDVALGGNATCTITRLVAASVSGLGGSGCKIG